MIEVDTKGVMAGARLEAGDDLAMELIKLRHKVRQHEVEKSTIAQNVTLPMVDLNRMFMLAESILMYRKVAGEDGRLRAMGLEPLEGGDDPQD